MAIWGEWIRGNSQLAIALKYGITQQRVSQICAELKKEMGEATREELLAREMSLLDLLRTKLMELVDSEDPPAFDKDGCILRDEYHNIVRDPTSKLAAIDRLMRSIAQVCKTLGLDAPTKTTVDGKVTYTINGVDIRDVT